MSEVIKKAIIEMPEDLHTWLKVYAAKYGTSIKQLLLDLIVEFKKTKK